MALIAVAACCGCQSNRSADQPPPKPPGEVQGLSPEDAPMQTLHVRVLYRERMMLPPTARVTVVLEDAAKMDVKAELIAQETVPAEAGPPYKITLTYDPARLTRQGRYGVRARIDNQENQLLFISTQFIPAFGTHGSADSAPNDPIEVLVQRVPREASRRSSPGASLTETRWQLTMLNEKESGAGAGGRVPFITLMEKDSRMAGFAGCNQMSGGYTLEGEQISFSAIAMTARACVEGMELERDLGKAIGQTVRYTLSGKTLTFYSEDGRAVAQFEATDAEPNPELTPPPGSRPR